MPVEPDLLAILVCPDNHRPLRQMDAATLKRVNERIAAGTLRNRRGETLSRPLDEALVRDGGDLFYPVENGIPALLVEEGVPLD